MNMFELADVLQAKTKSLREGWGWPATEITAVPFHTSTVSPQAGTGLRVRVEVGFLPSYIPFGVNSKCLAGMSSPFILTLLSVIKRLPLVFMDHMKSKGIFQLSLSCIAGGLMWRVKAVVFLQHRTEVFCGCFCYNLSHRKEATVWKPTSMRLPKDYCVFIAIYTLEGPL